MRNAFHPQVEHDCSTIHNKQQLYNNGLRNNYREAGVLKSSKIGSRLLTTSEHRQHPKLAPARSTTEKTARARQSSNKMKNFMFQPAKTLVFCLDS